ncbi:hypothetical protein ABZ721_33195 [Streptomyces sp. NPDC006733]|uniref:hypothetical protein n=1 Tax=Streptomyces sp. NPDC006733 TaxID=3155460 RepID=UPI0033F9779E
MPPRVQRWTLLKLANLAGVPSKVAYEARDRGVLHPDVLTPSDVLPLLTFDSLRRVSWPRENYARNTPQRLRLWESMAIERSRIDIDAVPRIAGLYVHPAGADLATLPSQHAITSLELAENDTPHLYLPLGLWAVQTTVALQAGADGLHRPEDGVA